MRERRSTIYGLIDPRNEALRYIGKTTGLAIARAYIHTASMAETSLKASWVMALRTFERWPEYVVIEVIEHWQANEAEEFWIAYYASLGAPLLNETTGPGGRRRIPKLDAEARLAAMVDTYDHLRLPPRKVLVNNPEKEL